MNVFNKLIKSKFLPYIFLGFIIFLSQFLIHYPDYLGYKNKPLDKWYTGQVSWFDPWDINVYMSVINWGKRDGLLFNNVYSTFNYKPAPIYTIYSMLGKLNKIVNLSPQLMFHLSAIFFGLGFFAVIFLTTKLITTNIWERVGLVSLIVFGSGFGWLFFPNLQVPDLFATGFTTYSSFQRAHEAVSSSLYLLIIYFIFTIIENGQKQHLFLTSFIFLILCFFHFYMALLIILITFIMTIIKWFKTKNNYLFSLLIGFFISCFIYVMIVYQSFINNPGFSGLLLQEQQVPSPFLLIFAFGLLTPLIIMSFFIKHKDNILRYLIIWFMVQLILLYLPFGFRRLFIRNFFVPGALLSFMVLKQIKDKLNFSFIFLALIVFSSISSIFVFQKRIAELKTSNSWVYITKEEGEAINYLEKNIPPEKGILSSYIIGNLIPSHTTKRVYLGHQFQTENFEEKMAKSLIFFEQKIDNNSAYQFLYDSHIDYIFFGPMERKLANNKNLDYNFLSNIFNNEKVIIYEVK